MRELPSVLHVFDFPHAVTAFIGSVLVSLGRPAGAAGAPAGGARAAQTLPFTLLTGLLCNRPACRLVCLVGPLTADVMRAELTRFVRGILQALPPSHYEPPHFVRDGLALLTVLLINLPHSYTDGLLSDEFFDALSAFWMRMGSVLAGALLTYFVRRPDGGRLLARVSPSLQGTIATGDAGHGSEMVAVLRRRCRRSRRCDRCGHPSSTLKTCECRIATYCSRRCQKSNWLQHRAVCPLRGGTQ